MTRHPLVVCAMLLVAGIAPICGCDNAVPTPVARFHVVLTPEGEPLGRNGGHDAPSIMAVARDRASGRLRQMDEEGVSLTDAGLRIDRPAPGAEAQLWVAGCVPLSLPVVPTGEPRKLTYGPRARLRLVTDGPPPAPPYEIHLTFIWRGPGDRPDARLRHQFQGAVAEGTLADGGSPIGNPLAFVGNEGPIARFSSAGPHRVRWTLMRVFRSDGVYTAQGYTAPDAGLSIEVKDGVEDQVIDITIPSEAIRDGMQSMGK